MRILCLANRLSLIGGAERSQSSLVAALSARGHVVGVLHEPDDMPESRSYWNPSGPFIEVPGLQMSGRSPRRTVSGLAAAAAAARAFEPDVVYTYLHYQLSTGLAVAKASRAGFVHHARVPAPTISGRRRFWWPLLRADRVIFVSRFTAQEYVDAGFDTQRAVTIHNGIDITAFAPLPRVDRQALRRRFGFSDTDTVLIYAGRSGPDKGLAMLTQVLRAVRSDPGTRCLILTDADLARTPEGRALSLAAEGARRRGAGVAERCGGAPGRLGPRVGPQPVARTLRSQRDRADGLRCPCRRHPRGRDPGDPHRRARAAPCRPMGRVWDGGQGPVAQPVAHP